jgi:hypothetical protein
MSTSSLLAATLPSPAPAAEPSPRRRPAVVVGGSLLAGLAAAVALVAGPLAGGREAVITGGLLLGFAVGWALLAVLSARFTHRPQRWAAVPAAAMGISGAGLIALAPAAGPPAACSRGCCIPSSLSSRSLRSAGAMRRWPTRPPSPWRASPVAA